MKKTLLLMAALLATASMQAIELQVQPKPAKHINNGIPTADMPEAPGDIVRNPVSLQGRGDFLSLDFGICDEPYNVVRINGSQKKGDVQAYATELTPEVLADFVGNSIYGMSFYSGYNQQLSANAIKSATIFLSHDLEEEPFMTKEVTLKTTGYMEQYFAEFDTPYPISEGETIYMGLKYTIANARDYPVVIDYVYHGAYEGGWVAVYDTDGVPTWGNIADSYGYVCLWATIAGTEMPQDKAAAAVYDSPIAVYDTDNFSVYYLVGNTGANAVMSFDAQFNVGDQEPFTRTYTLNQPMSYNQAALLQLPDINYPAAQPEPIDVRITVTKVNGVDNNETAVNTAAATVQVVPQGKDYKRNIVIEEFTGTWCGWCPRGIVSMEKFRSEYTDGSIIPVCVHAGDEMMSEDFTQLLATVSSYPFAVVSRILGDDPDYDTLTGLIDQVKTVPAIAKIEATAALDPQAATLSVNTSSQFTFDMNDANKRFAICYIVTEDNVGPYDQDNYYAGGSYGEMEGWESHSSPHPTVYNDVARILTSYTGHQGSVPAKVTAGNAYEHIYDIDLTPELMAKKDDLSVVAYLLNLANGTIENASLVRPANIGTTGVSDIKIDATATDAPVEYYNLQGIRVEQPATGIYIRRQGNTATKVVL